MISLTPSGRRAEEFAALVEGRAAQSAEQAELLELVGALQRVETPAPRAAHVAELRAQLMAEAEVALGAVPRKLALPATSPRRRDRRVAIAAGAIALVGATSSVAMASQSAVPGDALYPIKRAIEGANTSLRSDDGAKADQLLSNARDRLTEAEELAERPERAPQVPETLREFRDQSNEAAALLLDEYSRSSDPDRIETLRNFTAASVGQLYALGNLLPSSMSESLAQTVDTLAAIDARAAAACPTCAGGLPEAPVPAPDPQAAAIADLLAKVNEVAPNTPLIPTEGRTDGATVPPPDGDDPATAPARPDDEKPAAPNQPATPEKPKGPLQTITDPLIGEDGLVDGLVTGVVDPLLSGLLGGLLGQTPDE